MRRRTPTLFRRIGSLALSCGLCVSLAQAEEPSVSKGPFGYPPVQLSPIAEQAQVRLGLRAGDHANAVDDIHRRQLIAEINELRTRPWHRFDGKAANPVVVFRVEQPGATALWLTLTRQDLTELRRGPSLTSGGYSRELNLQRYPGLQRLLQDARP